MTVLATQVVRSDKVALIQTVLIKDHTTAVVMLSMTVVLEIETLFTLATTFDCHNYSINLHNH